VGGPDAFQRQDERQGKLQHLRRLLQQHR